MQRFWSATLAILVILSIPVVPFVNTASVEAAACTYVLGFQTVHDAIPDTVGDCKVNVHYNPANGDGLQETNNGLMVWRKADNFTAFTDGYRSWVNGPYGIMQRLNTERFDWEPIDPQAIALNLNDLPAGTSLDSKSTRYTYNEQLIKESKDPAAAAAVIQQSGRVLGYMALYQNATQSGLAGTTAVVSQVIVFQNAEGAHFAFENPTLPATGVQKVSAPPFGDESIAYSVTVAGKDKDKTMYIEYDIMMRKGNIVTMTSTAGKLGNLSIDDAIKYAQLVESRVK